MFFKRTNSHSTRTETSAVNRPQYIDLEAISPLLPVVPQQDVGIIALADNIRKVGLKEPVDLYYDKTAYYLLSGARRIAAHKLLGKKEIEARIYTDPKDSIDILLAKNAFGRKSALYLCEIARFLCENIGMNVLEAASKLEVSSSQLRKLLKLSELSAEEKRQILASDLSDKQLYEIAEIDNAVLRARVISKLYKSRESLRDIIFETRAEQNKPKFCATNLVDNSFKRLVGQISSLGKVADLEKSECKEQTVYTVTVSN